MIIAALLTIVCGWFAWAAFWMNEAEREQRRLDQQERRK